MSVSVSLEYGRIFNSAPSLLLLLAADETFTVLGASDVYLATTGLTRDGIVGRPAAAVLSDLHPEHGQADLLLASLRTVVATRQPDTIPARSCRVRRAAADGGGHQERHWSFLHSPVIAEDGAISSIIHRVDDVTDLVRAQQNRESLEQERRRAGALLEAAAAVERERVRLYGLLHDAPAAVCVLRGPNHVFELANGRYLELVQRPAADLIGQPVRAALPELVAQGCVEILDRVYATGSPFSGSELRVVLQPANGTGGEERFVNVTYQPTHDHHGEVDGIFVHAVDITPQVRARRDVEALATGIAAERNRAVESEQAREQLRDLAERERRFYHAILSSTPDLVYVFNLEHRFIYANDALLHMWGRTRETALGKNCLELGYEPWHAAMHDREIEQVIATRQPIRGEVPFTGTDGRRIYDYIFVPVFAADGTVEAVAGTTRDVTEMARARETVVERRAELERLVAERTGRLREAVEQMEEFSYTISHDLRSPVRAMRGYAEVLLQDYGKRLDAEGRELLSRIERSGTRMDRLIQDLLTYSRISRREIRLEPVPLDRLIRDVMEQYPELQPDRARIDLPLVLPLVLAHEPSLSQVVSNLLSNAVKFVPAGRRPHVQITVEGRDQTVRLTFADNGIGIAPEHQARLFGMFERVHVDQRFEGTGIGLAIVRKAMERMNGRAGMESDGRSGSRFWIELPVPATA